jgi:hypothetical protein
MDEIVRTAELHAGGNREPGAVFERARVGDALVDAETHFLLSVRVVGEHLLRESDRCGTEDLGGVDLELDLVDLHVLPDKAKELVREGIGGGVVQERGLWGHAREQSQALRGRDETIVVRVLARTGLNLEPAAGRIARQIGELSLRRGSWDSLVVELGIAVSVPHVRLCVAAREEDLAGDLALDGIKPRASTSAVDEGEPLVGEITVRHVPMPNLGLPMGAGEDCALADVADEAETDAFRGDEGSRHCQEMSR